MTMRSQHVETDELFQAGMDHWFRRDRQTAVELFHRVLDLDPDHPDALNQLGIAAFDRGDLERAEHLFRDAIVGGARALEVDDAGFLSWSDEGNRPYLRAHHNLALVCRRTGRWAEAARIHEQMLQWSPSDHQGARFLLGEEYVRLGRLERAIALLERSGEHPGVLFTLGLARIEVGDTELGLLTLLRGMARNRYVAPMLLGEPWEPLPVWESVQGSEPAAAEEYARVCADLWDRDPSYLGHLEALFRHEAVRTWREDLDEIEVELERQRERARRRPLLERRERLLSERRLRRLLTGMAWAVEVRVTGALDVESAAAPKHPAAWVTDLRLAVPAVAPRSGYPERARAIARYHGRITEAATAWGHGDAIETAIRCHRRVDGRGCAGHVRAIREGHAIAWECTRCHDGGRIASFEGTQWDLSGADAAGLTGLRVTLDQYLELEAIAATPEARRPIARAIWRADGAELHGSADEYEALAAAAEADLAPDLAQFVRSR